jgi:hypothetical protein
MPDGGDDSPFFSKTAASLVFTDDSDPEEGEIEAEKVVAQRDQTVFDEIMRQAETQEINLKREAYSFID